MTWQHTSTLLNSGDRDLPSPRPDPDSSLFHLDKTEIKVQPRMRNAIKEHGTTIKQMKQCLLTALPHSFNITTNINVNLPMLNSGDRDLPSPRPDPDSSLFHLDKTEIKVQPRLCYKRTCDNNQTEASMFILQHCLTFLTWHDNKHKHQLTERGSWNSWNGLPWDILKR
jgi:hypothetical protein